MIVEHRPRIRFRLPLRVPWVPETVALDVALDQLGTCLFPERWGCHLRFEELPLLRDDRGVFQIVQNRKRRIRSDPELDEVVAMYASTYEHLRLALENEPIAALALERGAPVPLDWRLFWTQWERAFGTGLMRLSGRRLKVRLNSPQFEGWLEKMRPRVRLSDQLVNSVIEALEAAHARDPNRTTDKKRLVGVIQDVVFPFRVIRDEVDKQVWSILRDELRCVGRPPAQARLWNRELLAEIRKLYV